MNVDLLHAGNAAVVQRLDWDAHAKGNLREDGQFLSGVRALDVESRIGFCVTAPLGLSERVGVTLSLLAHAGQDEIAGAVENTLQGHDLIGSETLRQGSDDGNPACDASFEGDGASVPPGCVEDLRTVQ